jgi:serine phosphatase RsbU (regulator of sigma subunit)
MLAELTGEVLGARSGRLFVADYALRKVRELRGDGTTGEEFMLEGTIAGRAFASGAWVEHGDRPVTVWIPLSEGSERIGLLELIFDESSSWETASADVADIARTMMLIIVSGRRYTDVMLRARRARPLSDAAEAQWDLLPPLSYAGTHIKVSGILEPAYSIGGDSFDYAINPGRLDLAIVDAVGHGLPAVLMASVAINTLRNARRAQRTLDDAYRQADQRIAEQFGQSYYVTGQIATLEMSSGRLTWLNAGHVRPLLVRNGSFVGELECTPSMPMGLGGKVVQIAVEPLQSGDRVLFHTDGVSESRSPDGTLFGTERLADFLVRATMDGVSVAETVRRLSANVVAHVGAGLKDDATVFLVEYINHHKSNE